MAGSTDIRAGKAYVEMYVDDKGVGKGLANVQKELAAFGAGVSAIGTKFLALGAGIVTPLLAAAKTFATVGSDLNDMSARTGMGTNALSELGFAAEQCGANLGDVETGVRRMQKAISAATEGPLASLKGMAPEAQFMKIAESLAGISDPTARAAAAMEVFGKSGTSLLPMVADVKALRAEAVKLGRSMGPEQAAAADALGDAWDKAKTAMQGTAIAAGGALAPALTSLSTDLTSLFGRVSQWIAAHEQVAETALRAGSAVLVFGAALKAAGVAMTLAAANPVVFTIGALGIALAATQGAFDGLTESTRKYQDVAGKSLADADQQRRAARDLMGELGTLADRQQFGASVQERSQTIIKQLTDSYGDLGLSIDATTGKINGMAGAQEKLNGLMGAAAMRELAEAEVAAKSQLDASRAKVAGIMQRSEDYAHAAGAFTFGGAGGIIEAEGAKQSELQSRLRLLHGRMEDLRGGKMAGAFGPEAKPAGGGLDLAALTNPMRVADQFKKMLAREANQRALDAIDDEEEKALAAVDQKWAEELDAGKRTWAEMMAIEAAAAAETDAVRRRFSLKREEEENRAAETTAGNRQRLDDEIARAKIEATMTGHAKEKALADLELQQALRGAAAAGLDPEQVKRLHELKEPAKGLEIPEAAKISGTFSGAVAAQMAGAGGFQLLGRKLDEQKHYMQKAAEHLADIKANLRVGN
jgi:phage gpG-like protein